MRVKNKETGQSYEPYGHFSDTKRYFITEAFKKEYIGFSLKRSRNKISNQDMKYYNRQVTDLSGCDKFVEICLGTDGMFAFARASVKDGKCYVEKAILSNSVMDEESVSLLMDKEDNVQVECDPSFSSYVRALRLYADDVRGRKPFPDPKKRISAHLDFIRDSVFIPNDQGKRIIVQAKLIRHLLLKHLRCHKRVRIL